jgi:hypothetical protein
LKIFGKIKKQLTNKKTGFIIRPLKKEIEESETDKGVRNLMYGIPDPFLRCDSNDLFYKDYMSSRKKGYGVT